MTETFTYKGYSVEIGDLPGPRQAYWKILPGGEQNQVECGDLTDLQLIAKRNIDQLIWQYANAPAPEPEQEQEQDEQTQRHEEQKETQPEA